MNPYYSTSGYPGYGANGDSASARSEFAAIQSAFDKLPTLGVGNALRFVRVNSTGTALESAILNSAQLRNNLSDPTGTGAAVFAQDPALVFTTTKTSPVNADSVLLVDSAALNVIKNLSLSNLATFIFSSFYTSADARYMSYYDLRNYIYPSIDGNWVDLAGGAGYLPYCSNQQWGGAQIGLMPDGSNGDAATQNIADTGQTSFGITGQLSMSQSFRISEGQTPPLVFLKLGKIGNPTDNAQVQIYSDNGSGLPNVPLGTLASISGKVLSSNTNSKFLAIPVVFPALTANTLYHIVCNRSSGVADASNYYTLRCSVAGSSNYPNGAAIAAGCAYGAGAVPNTPYTGVTLCFIIPNATANRFIQTGGRFGGDNGKLVFMDGTPWNQSKFLVKPMREFWSRTFTDVIRGQSWAASSTIADYAYGIDHDRLAITVDASGHVVLTWYDSLLGAQTVTGTTDVRTGTPDIGFKFRAEGDGADYLQLLINGVSEGTPKTTQTFTTTNDLRDLGHHIVGGGFPLAPTWAVNTIPTAELSTLGWTYTGPTEASSQFASGNKNYQIANAIGALASYYSRNPTFVNATGGSAFWKGQVPADGTNPFTLQYEDAAKKVIVSVFGNYIAVNGTGATDFYYQGDFKTRERVVGIHVKGSDYYITVDGKLAVDGTGKATTATANNAFTFGNLTAAAGSDVVTSYVKLSNTGMIIPHASNGASLFEYPHWSGDKSSLLPIAYNAGSPIAIKQLCGVEKNYVGNGTVFEESRAGITISPATTSTTPITVSDLECYVVGSEIEVNTDGRYPNTTVTAEAYVDTFVDGEAIVGGTRGYTQGNAGYNHTVGSSVIRKMRTFGLRKVDIRFYTTSGTLSNYITSRTMTVRGRK